MVAWKQYIRSFDSFFELSLAPTIEQQKAQQSQEHQMTQSQQQNQGRTIG